MRIYPSKPSPHRRPMGGGEKGEGGASRPASGSRPPRAALAAGSRIAGNGHWDVHSPGHPLRGCVLPTQDQNPLARDWPTLEGWHPPTPFYWHPWLAARSRARTGRRRPPNSKKSGSGRISICGSRPGGPGSRPCAGNPAPAVPWLPACRRAPAAPCSRRGCFPWGGGAWVLALAGSSPAGLRPALLASAGLRPSFRRRWSASPRGQ